MDPHAPPDAPPDLPATERVSPRFRDIDSWPVATMVQAMWEGQLAAAAAVQPALGAIAAAAEAAASLLRHAGRLVYVGAGTSGRIGVQDGAELPPTFDWPTERLVLLMAGGDAAFTRAIENAEDDTAAAEAAMAREQIGARDVAIGIAASGSTAFTIAAIRAARARGALTIGIANNPGGALLAAAAHPILVPTGAEVIAGSTRLQAGTAQKIVLNLLSTALMIRLGRVHQGLMVDMQARNEKLRRRALRMLGQLSGRDETACRAALTQADFRLKPALLILHGASVAQADSLLNRNNHSLRAALAELAP